MKCDNEDKSAQTEKTPRAAQTARVQMVRPTLVVVPEPGGSDGSTGRA